MTDKREPPLNVRLKGDKDKGRFCTHGVELIKWCKICDGAGTVGATPEPTELRESLRPAAKEYLREWSDNYRRHGELALLHWDGGNIEYHLANFAARAAQSLPSPAPQKERFEAYERTHGRGDMLQPHPGGYNNEGTQSRWNLWQAAASPVQPVGSADKEQG